MGKFARVFKCICAIVALGILVTGLAAQVERTSEVSASATNTVFAASITEDYTDDATEHATIRRAGVLSAPEVSREAAGNRSDESIARRTASGSSAAASLRFITMLTLVIAAASVCSSMIRPVVHAEGRVRSAEQTIISYIHSQGNFIG